MSEEITKYNFDTLTSLSDYEDEDGSWVDYDDHKNELEKLNKIITRLQDEIIASKPYCKKDGCNWKARENENTCFYHQH